MTMQPRSDRHLPDILDSLYLGSTPAYRDDVLAHATRSRQRPAWTFPGRWFPMVELARQPAVVRRVPWRPIAVATLILLLIAAGLTLYVGSRSHVPPPFGPAKNGLIAYSADDAVYTADPVTGVARKLAVSGAALGADTVISDPFFSPDGTRIVFVSGIRGLLTGPGLLWAINADGSGQKQLTPTEQEDITGWDFTPDGKSVEFVSDVGGVQTLSIVGLDGSGLRTLAALPKPVGELGFRPPDGKQILFRGPNDAVNAGELYVMNADGTNLQTLIKNSAPLESAVWSPDGSQIAYGTGQRIRIMSADGSNDHLLHPDAVGWEGWPRWSPDGTRLAFQRFDGAKLAYGVARADGSGPVVAIQSVMGGTGANYEWSPDSSVILARPNDNPHQELWDPTTGAVRAAPWTAVTYPTWQRLAP